MKKNLIFCLILTAVMALTMTAPAGIQPAFATEPQDQPAYLETMNAVRLGDYSNERSDYPNLTDEQFANFRVVSTKGMRENVLYRTASPVDPKRNRNTYADAAIAKAGVATVLNLSDTPEKVVNHAGYADSYYANHTKHIEVGMRTNYGAESFNAILGQGMRFLLDPENPAPYEVNCVEGKDRTGFVIAVLECLAGASYDELVEDYLITYYNYFNVTADHPSYFLLADFNLVKQLEFAFDVKDLRTCDLKASAEAYLEKKCGLTEEEIVALAEVFSRNNPMMARTKTLKVSSKSLKKHARTIPRAKAFTVKYAAGKVTFKKTGGSKNVLISKGGKVTVKKGLKKKTYTVKVKVSAAGSGDVMPAARTVKLKVRVK